MKIANYICALMAILTLASCSTEKRTINVSGEGTITFVPDMVVINIKIENINPTLNDSLVQTKETMIELLNTCHKYGIKEEDIKSSYVNTDKKYTSPYGNEKPVFIGYSATQNTQITYRDLGKFEDLSRDILSLRIKSISGISFNHSKKTEYENEADMLALDNAKLSAQRIAEKMGIKLGEVLYISNKSNDIPEDYARGFETLAFSKSLASGIVISPGILAVKRNIQVIFGIKK